MKKQILKNKESLRNLWDNIIVLIFIEHALSSYTKINSNGLRT